MVWIAQLSDIHLDGSDEAYDRFRQATDWLAALHPPVAATLLTGDLVENGVGMVEDYRLIRDTLSAIAPVTAIPGNADDLDAFDAVFGWDRDPGMEEAGGCWLVPVGSGVWMLPLDSSDCEENDWMLDPEPIAEAREEIDALPDDAVVLVALHHPPMAVGHSIVDQLCLRDVPELETLVRDDPRIVGVVCGHIHSGVATTFAGKPLIVGPAVWSGTRLDAELGERSSDLTALDVPPMLTMHRLEDGRLISWFRAVV
ncbi:MAG: metallophosphoesterase [Thermomicrobiales bacterium]